MNAKFASRTIEWPTLILIALCYLFWGFSTTALAGFSPALGVIATGVAITFHSSLTHEVIHGHPTPHRWLNFALVFPALSLAIPFQRFRDTHLDHHKDARLTDPYDDPETNFMDAADWAALSLPCRLLLSANNTLLGRLILGPLISQIFFVGSDLRAWRAGDWRVLRGWLWHIPALIPVVVWVWLVSPLGVLAYVIAAYIGIALLKIRTFAEHRAHEIAAERTVIIEDRGPLALLFLNNNLHSVHHNHPGLAWYQLPARYSRDKDRFLTQNGDYRFRSYAELFARHFWRAKDPVPHPLWARGWKSRP